MGANTKDAERMASTIPATTASDAAYAGNATARHGPRANDATVTDADVAVSAVPTTITATHATTTATAATTATTAATTKV